MADQVQVSVSTTAQQARRDQARKAAYDICYTKIRDLVQQGKLNTGDYILLITAGMEVVSGYKDLSGPEKKQIVLDVFNRIVGEFQFEPQVQQSLQLAAAVAVPAAIDAIHAAANGKFALKVKKKCNTCFASCC